MGIQTSRVGEGGGEEVKVWEWSVSVNLINGWAEISHAFVDDRDHVIVKMVQNSNPFLICVDIFNKSIL